MSSRIIGRLLTSLIATSILCVTGPVLIAGHIKALAEHIRWEGSAELRFGDGNDYLSRPALGPRLITTNAPGRGGESNGFGSMYKLTLNDSSSPQSNTLTISASRTLGPLLSSVSPAMFDTTAEKRFAIEITAAFRVLPQGKRSKVDITYSPSAAISIVNNDPDIAGIFDRSASFSIVDYSETGPSGIINLQSKREKDISNGISDPNKKDSPFDSLHSIHLEGLYAVKINVDLGTIAAGVPTTHSATSSWSSLSFELKSTIITVVPEPRTFVLAMSALGFIVLVRIRQKLRSPQ